MYYHVCLECGANLDPGEQCDCTKEKALHAQQREQGTDKIIYVYSIKKTIENQV